MKEPKQFTKKPVTITAVQWDGNNEYEIADFMPAEKFNISDSGAKLFIETPEGCMTASILDWVIKGVKGEFYPCKPDIFEATYSPAVAPSRSPAEHDNFQQHGLMEEINEMAGAGPSEREALEYQCIGGRGPEKQAECFHLLPGEPHSWKCECFHLRKVVAALQARAAVPQAPLAELLQPLKDACDRDWKDETPEQIVAIAANAIYWRARAAAVPAPAR